MSDFSNEERELVFSLAENLIGSCQQGTTRKDILVTNVGRRMSATGYSELSEYLEFVEKDDAEFQQLLSALTIHTTSWFRVSSREIICTSKVLPRDDALSF
jgi:chemotaxis methyl-accepting protein methylase